MEMLAKLFSSKPLVKIMRLFLFSPHDPFDIDDITKRTQTTTKAARYEIKLLEDIGFLKKKTFTKTHRKTVGKKTTTRKQRTTGWMLDERFPYLHPLRALVIDTDLIDEGEVKQRLQKVGTIKLLLISGVFLQHSQSRVDLLVVGNKINKTALNKTIANLEATIGTEIRFTMLTPDELKYRLDVRDRLVRDVFDYPHHILVNKLPALSLDN